MSEYVANKSFALSVAATAAFVDISSAYIFAKGSPAAAGVKRGRVARVKNTHATQIMYIKFVGTAVADATADIIVTAGETVNFMWPEGRHQLSFIASGAATTGILHIGDFLF